jgi:hypothetical protein
MLPDKSPRDIELMVQSLIARQGLVRPGFSPSNYNDLAVISIMEHFIARTDRELEGLPHESREELRRALGGKKKTRRRTKKIKKRKHK